MIRFLSPRRETDRNTAERIYAQIADASRRPGFYRDLGVPDTVDGRFDMLVVHLFAVLTVLMRNGEEGARWSENLLEVFVVEMDSGLRDLGVSDTKVGKRMRTLYGAFGGRMSAYQTAIEDDTQALAEAIDRNLFPDEGNAATADVLANYVMVCLAQFDQCSLQGILENQFEWPMVPEKR